jgi:hypothetical protein
MNKKDVNQIKSCDNNAHSTIRNFVAKRDEGRIISINSLTSKQKSQLIMQIRKNTKSF